MAFLTAMPVMAEELQPRAEILNTLVKVNDHYLKKHPDPLLGIPYYSRKKVYEANIWTRAVYFEGLMALHSIYPDNRYYDYAYSWADGFKWGMRRDDSTTRNADNYCAAQVYIDLYRLTPRPEMLTKTKATMNMLVNTPQVDDWTWIDAIQMGMPILAKLSATTGDPRYAEKAYEMYSWTRNTLAGVFTTRKMACGGATPTLCPPTRSPTAKTAIGRAVTVGSWLLS